MEYTTPFNEVRFAWNHFREISIWKNGMPSTHVNIIISLEELKEVLRKYSNRNYEYVYSYLGENYEFILDKVDEQITISKQDECDRRRKSYRHPLIIPYWEFVKAVRMIEKSEGAV